MRLGKIETMEEVGGKTNEKKLVWFAMSAPYCKELEAQQLLEREDIESFVPLCYKIVKHRDGQKKRVLKPAIPNYIFVRTTRSILQEVKNRILILQYLTRRENGKNIPIIVPDYQMEQFIRVINTYNENLVFLKPEEVNLKKGTPVRIVGGAFDGIEGIFIKVKGHRNRRVVVQIEGITAVAIAEVTQDLIEVL